MLYVINFAIDNYLSMRSLKSMKKLVLSFLSVFLLCNSAFAAETFVAATNPIWPPMEMVDMNKEIVGFDMDMVAAVAKELGREPKFLNTAWDGIFATLESKQADLLASCVTITPERQKKYAFSQPYYLVRQSLIVPNDSSIMTQNDLEGKTVGVQIGTTAVEALRKSGVNVIIKTYDDLALVFEDLKNGRLDAAMCDDPVGRYYANRKEGFSEIMKLAFVTEEVEEIGFVFRKEDTALVEQVNQALNAMKENGTEAQILEKWFGKE